MRILVTGGAGYIGSVFLREILDKGYDVTLVDTLFFGEDSIKDIKDRIRLVKKDIRDLEASDIRGADAVVDFAAMSNDPAGELSSELTYLINHLGRYRVAKLAKQEKVARYIAPSSCAIYGVTDGIADENSPVHPLTAYAKANYAWENDIAKLADDKFCVVTLRQSTVFGVSYKMRFDLLVNNFTLQVFKNKKIKIKGDGMEFRPFVHVKDDCAAIISAIEAESELVNKQIFNVGSSSENVKVADLVDLVPKTLGIECEKEFGEWVDKRNYRISFEKISKVLNFRTKRGIDFGVREVYKALQDGIIDGDDKRTVTLEWYKELIAKGVLKLP